MIGYGGNQFLLLDSPVHWNVWKHVLFPIILLSNRLKGESLFLITKCLTVTVRKISDKLSYDISRFWNVQIERNVIECCKRTVSLQKYERKKLKNCLMKSTLKAVCRRVRRKIMMITVYSKEMEKMNTYNT